MTQNKHIGTLNVILAKKQGNEYIKNYSFQTRFDAFKIFPNFLAEHDVSKTLDVIPSNYAGKFDLVYIKGLYIEQYNAIVCIDSSSNTNTSSSSNGKDTQQQQNTCIFDLFPKDTEKVCNISKIGNTLVLDNTEYTISISNLPNILNERLKVKPAYILLIREHIDVSTSTNTDTNTDTVPEIYGFFILSQELSNTTGFQQNDNELVAPIYQMSVEIEKIPEIGKVSINLSENPNNWQVSFVSSIYYPPGIQLDLFGIKFIVANVIKSTTNLYRYSAYLKVTLEQAGALGRVDNTGAYIRRPKSKIQLMYEQASNQGEIDLSKVSYLDPENYYWERLSDLTVAYQNISRNRSQNTLKTPFEQSFERFCENVQWSIEPIRKTISELYIGSQILIIPWLRRIKVIDKYYNEISWLPVSSLLSMYNLQKETQQTWYNSILEEIKDYVPSDLQNVPCLDLTENREFSCRQVALSGKPHKIKIFAKNKYKRAVTMYECPNYVKPVTGSLESLLATLQERKDEFLDNGFYIFACDGDKRPTVRFTYNYKVDYNPVTRLYIGDVQERECKDSSGMVITADDQPVFWYDSLFIDVGNAELNKKFNMLVRTFLKSLVFTANPIIALDTKEDYLDSYFPYPISPWNFTVYLQPVVSTEKVTDLDGTEHVVDIVRWIPTKNPYPVYDVNLLYTSLQKTNNYVYHVRRLPDYIWTGAYMSVVRIPTIQKSDSTLNKDIVQQGFNVGGVLVGNTVTPFSLLITENQTQMPILNEKIIKEYLSDISKVPDSIFYEVRMLTGLEKQMHQYGITLQDVLAQFNKSMFDKTLHFDLKLLIEGTSTTNSDSPILYVTDPTHPDKNQCIKLNYKVLKPNNSLYVIVCYDVTKNENNEIKSVKLNTDEIHFSRILITVPSMRIEKNIILVFGTAIYFITARVFGSPPYLAVPYIFDLEAEYKQSLTNEYTVLTVDGYTNVLTNVKQFVDKSIEFTFEGKQEDLCKKVSKHYELIDLLLPYRIVKFKNEFYVISDTTIEIEGDFVRVTCRADNRIRFYQKWDEIAADVSPELCDIEIYPRIPNRHAPISKIYAFSNRISAVKNYLLKVIQYSYYDSHKLEHGETDFPFDIDTL